MVLFYSGSFAVLAESVFLHSPSYFFPCAFNLLCSLLCKKGCLPYEIGLLKKATVFDVGNNLLTGPLPCSLACLESIEQLNFAGNYLYGEVGFAPRDHNKFTYTKSTCAFTNSNMHN